MSDKSFKFRTAIAALAMVFVFFCGMKPAAAQQDDSPQKTSQANATPLPEPSPPPQDEMPPLAPQLNIPAAAAVNAPPAAGGSGAVASGTPYPAMPPGPYFSLQAQQFHSSEQEKLRLGRPIDPGYGRPADSYSAHANQNRLEANAQSTQVDGRSLTQVELQRLAAHDIVLLIDRSASMSAMDCPTGNVSSAMGFVPSLLGIPLLSTSRWNWCLKQTSELSSQTQGIYSQGITVVLFSTGFVTFPNVRLSDLQAIFQRNFPMGGTNLAPALGTQIGEYFQRREYNRGNVKPLMIGIITDGCPTSKNAVRAAIIDATRLMRKPDEITIIFFMVGGMDFVGTRFVHDLCSNLVSQGAVYPIVKEVSFEELQHTGLAKAIADKLQ